jgi:hypothetical protein
MIKFAAVFIPAPHRSKNGRNSCTKLPFYRLKKKPGPFKTDQALFASNLAKA